MIARMTVDNFKAIRHVEVKLSPFTVLIGPNDAGKTSFLEAVYALSETTRSSLPQCFWSPWQFRELVHNNLPDANVRFTAELTASADPPTNPRTIEPGLSYSLSVAFAQGRSCTVREERIATKTQVIELQNQVNIQYTSICALKRGTFNPEIGSAELQAVGQSLRGAALARWDVEELAMPSRLPPQRRYPFDPSGYGLATCIAEMKLGRGTNFESLRDEFCRQFPTFDDIIIDRANVTSVERDEHFGKRTGSQGEGYALTLLKKDGVRIPAGLASGGTLVTLAFLTLLHLPEPRELLLIEEPENALHPGRLGEVISLLRKAVASGGERQVILTTHSPLLLDYVDPSEVRVFLRNQQQEVTVYDVADVPEIRERLKYLNLGELVYNEGEAALVKEIQENASAYSQ